MIKKLICAVTAAVLLFTGCQTVQEPARPEEVALYPVTVNGISFSEAPKRVVSLCGQITALLSAQGYADSVVGVSQDQQLGDGQQAVGSAESPDTDAILALHPDLLLTQQAIPAKKINQLKEAGVTVLVLPVPQNFYQLEAQVQELYSLYDGAPPSGDQASGIESGLSKAQTVFQSYRQDLKSMAARAASGEAKSFVFVLSPDGSRIATGKTREGNLIGLIGCNVAQDASGYQMDFQEIVQQSPDYVFVPKGQSIAIQQNADFQQLEAVANGRIVEIDTEALDSQDPVRVAELCKNVCRHLYEKA